LLNIADGLVTPLLPLENKFWPSNVLPMRCVVFYPIMSTTKTAAFVRRL